MNSWRKGKLAIARTLRLDVNHPQVHYARFLVERLDGVSRWLDVGCGRQVVPPDKMSLEDQRACFGKVPFLVGIDVDQAILQHPLLKARVIGLRGALPFAADSFDLVTANMVVEHIQDPSTFLSGYLPSVTSLRSFYLPYTELSLLPGVHCPRHARIPQAQARMDPRRATRRGHIQDALRSEYTAKSCALGQSCRVRGGDITG